MRYFDAHLKRRWKIIYDPISIEDWIFDSNNQWILNFKDMKYLWCNHAFIVETGELYNVSTIEVKTALKFWFEERFKKRVITCWSFNGKLKSSLKLILKRGVIKNV